MSESPTNLPTRSTHRYLDIMTVRPSQGARPSSPMQFRPFTTQSAYSHQDSSKLPSSSIHTGSLNRSVESSSLSAISGKLSLKNHNQHKLVSTVKSASGYDHTNLLIEPVLLPNMQHVHIDSQQDLEESCLFYPTGSKNRNIRREIESSVIKHHILENSRMKANRKRKDKFRIVPIDPYANAKGPPLVYLKKKDEEFEKLVQNIKSTEGKIAGLVQIRL
jgi:hypothetical protein